MICSKCGSQVEDGAKFCPSCGADLTSEAGQSSTQYERVEGETVNAGSSGYQSTGFEGKGTVNDRNIALAIILTIITCGIYGIYWMYVLNEDINKLSDHPEATSGGMVILFTIITCGIYGLYWYYKMGERVEEIRAKKGMPNGSSAILFLILGIFGLGIVNYCIMQSNINSAVA